MTWSLDAWLLCVAWVLHLLDTAPFLEDVPLDGDTE